MGERFDITIRMSPEQKRRFCRSLRLNSLSRLVRSIRRWMTSGGEWTSQAISILESWLSNQNLDIELRWIKELWLSSPTQLIVEWWLLIEKYQLSYLLFGKRVMRWESKMKGIQLFISQLEKMSSLQNDEESEGNSVNWVRTSKNLMLLYERSKRS